MLIWSHLLPQSDETSAAGLFSQLSVYRKEEINAFTVHLFLGFTNLTSLLNIMGKIPVLMLTNNFYFQISSVDHLSVIWCTKKRFFGWFSWREVIDLCAECQSSHYCLYSTLKYKHQPECCAIQSSTVEQQ